MTSKVVNLPKVLPLALSGNPLQGPPTSQSPAPSTPGNGRDRSRYRSRSRRPRPVVPLPDPGLGSSKSLKVQDCLKQMMDFVKEHNLPPIFGNDWSYEQLEKHLRHEAEIVSQPLKKLSYVSRELMMQLAIMSLYDLAVLIDDSVSMGFEQGGKRKEALKRVLHLLAELYGAVSGDTRGIKAIRFLNGEDDLSADNLKTKGEIDRVIDNHEFEGLTCIGASLVQKILKPFVFADKPWVKGTPKKLRQMKRPLLVIVITDGAVDGEPSTWLEKAVSSVMESLKAEKIGTKGVVFQFARVGNDKDAEAFLKYLNDESSVSEYVDTLSGSDLMDLMAERQAEGKDLTPVDQCKIINLLLGPIKSSTFKPLDDVKDDFDSIFDD